ncbi:hypothetical protein MIMGU_mgv1a0195072mg, partial [Erythranthe guttata]
NLIRKK